MNYQLIIPYETFAPPYQSPHPRNANGMEWRFDTTYNIVRVLKEATETLGGEIHMGFTHRQEHANLRNGELFQCISVFVKAHPDWIGAFFNRIATQGILSTHLLRAMLCGMEVQTVHYSAQDYSLDYEQNPVTKIGYRLVFAHLRTSGWLTSDGDEILQILDGGEVLL